MARSERTGDLKNLPKYNASGKVSVSPSSMYYNYNAKFNVLQKKVPCTILPGYMDYLVNICLQ